MRSRRRIVDAGPTATREDFVWFFLGEIFAERRGARRRLPPLAAPAAPPARSASGASSAARRGAETQNASMAMAKPRRDSGNAAAS